MAKISETELHQARGIRLARSSSTADSAAAVASPRRPSALVETVGGPGAGDGRCRCAQAGNDVAEKKIRREKRRGGSCDHDLEVQRSAVVQVCRDLASPD